jgi:glycosyltransferase involved in cell wall biosynthesis
MGRVPGETPEDSLLDFTASPAPGWTRGIPLKVLFLTPQLPWPLDQGARIRNYHLLRAVAAEHTVDLLSLDAAPSPPALSQGERGPVALPAHPWQGAGAGCDPVLPHPLGVGGGEGVRPLPLPPGEGRGEGVPSPLSALCRRLEVFPAPVRDRASRIRTLLRSSLPDLAHRAWQPALAARVRALTAAEAYEVVQISSLEMMPYRRAISSRAPHRPLVVFDDLNAEYQLQRRACLTDLSRPARWHAALYSALQWQRLRRYEAHVCQEAGAVIVVSPLDAALLRRIAPAARYVLIPNGVDTAAFPCRDTPPASPPELLFTGTMDYRPNVDAMLWFGETILPLLRQARPALRCLVVGKAPDPRLRTLAAQQSGLVVTGLVPAVQPYLARAAVYVVPMRMGSGTRLKVLEAMAAGVPVVSTRLGMEGIAANAEQYALLAETPAAFARAVLRLLDTPALAATLARRARTLAERRYDWAQLTPRLPALYRALAR